MYNSTLTEDGYNGLPEAQEVFDFYKSNPFYRYEHEHRKWEYGLALKFIREFGANTILNVGGGNSPLSSIFVKEGKKVTEIDPTPVDREFSGITYIHEEFPKKGLGKFDAVVCTSVIEHVQEDEKFFKKLLEHSSDLVFITTDFHPEGKAFSGAHYRTYNLDGIQHFINIGMEKGFSPVDVSAYRFSTEMVYNYTFASLAFRKENVR